MGSEMFFIWNSLPECVVEAQNVKIFENRLDKLWEKESFKFDWKEKYVGKVKLTEADEMDIEAELS